MSTTPPAHKAATGAGARKVAGSGAPKTRKSSGAEQEIGAPPSEMRKADSARVISDGLSDVRFLTVAEVAAVMRVSKMTVYRMVHGGELPAVRVGRSFRVTEAAVHDYLQAAFIEAG
ncbi:excisionase family DNA binding protein [Jatrophihabitans sp. GAS493]|nr:helix-turn-helix domain-containing protein [Jatrophihabitans sp. GAS493]SOD70670.1 excisionase family DNA binding protein [Jatrophihabitans sp. GAS493]